MIDCWLWDVVDFMRHEEDKIADSFGNQPVIKEKL